MTGTPAALLRMSRPYYVIQAVAPPVAGYVTASPLGVSWFEVMTVASVFGFLAMAAWAGNDFFDSTTDRRGDSKRFCGLYVAGGTGVFLAQRLSAWKVAAFVGVLIATGLALATTISASFFFLSLTCGLVGICYSLPLIRLKARGLGGAVLTACTYGTVAFVAGWTAADIRVPPAAIAFGVIMSGLVFGYDGLGHLVDRVDDETNRLRTFAVQLGVRRASKLLAVCQVLPVASIGILGLAGCLNVNLVGASLLFGFAVLTAGVLLFGNREQDLYAVRILSVPMLSAAFFLLA